jgi:hypothetical protein
MDLLTKTAMGFVAAMLAMSIGQLRADYQQPVKAPETTFIAPYSAPAPAPAPTVPQYVKTTSCAQVGVLAVAAGLPTVEQATALKVAYRESRCFSDAYNGKDPMGGSYGIYQISGFWCRPSTYWPQGWLQTKGVLDTCDDLFDPLINTNAMVAIWRNSGWLPWRTAN